MLPEASFLTKATLFLIGLVKVLIGYVWWESRKRNERTEQKVAETYTKMETEQQIDMRLAPLREHMKSLNKSLDANTQAQIRTSEQQVELTKTLHQLVGQLKAGNK